MTTKDFIIIAETIRSLPEHMRWEAAQAFAHSLPSTNPRFNAAKFVAACIA